jgi:hypothetical protein
VQRAGSVEAELELGVGDDDAAAGGMLGGSSVQGDRRVARLRATASPVLPVAASRSASSAVAQSACARSKETFSS